MTVSLLVVVDLYGGKGEGIIRGLGGQVRLVQPGSRSGAVGTQALAILLLAAFLLFLSDSPQSARGALDFAVLIQSPFEKASTQDRVGESTAMVIQSPFDKASTNFSESDDDELLEFKQELQEVASDPTCELCEQTIDSSKGEVRAKQRLFGLKCVHDICENAMHTCQRELRGDPKLQKAFIHLRDTDFPRWQRLCLKCQKPKTRTL